jgi:hypothetical protein
MEGTALFNSGFLGSSFNWWVGQIADDSTWRDNMLPGKFESKDTIPGWGRRYKVRIIGLHDKEEETIPSDQLPWAQVMYPITAGGGQTNAGETPNLRQGNFVFGFFLDGQDQQVPVIMGILGNNSQTALATKIGTTEQNFAATSGYAEGKDPPLLNAKPKVPDVGLGITKPKDPEQSKECAATPPGVKLNEFGLRSDLPLSKSQFADQQSALREAEARGLTGANKSAFLQQAIAKGIKDRCNFANSPQSGAAPGATIEQPDNPHQTTAADVKRNDYYNKKTVLMSPCNITSSTMKGMQTVIDNLTKDLNKYLNAANSYIDAVSSTKTDIDALIADAACQIAKYMKIVFDKIFEYALKKINKTLSPTVDLLYPNQRFKYSDMKEKITELLTAVYSKITSNLCAQIQGFLNKLLNKTKLPTPPKDKDGNDLPVTQSTPICSVEELTGSIVGQNMKEMNKSVDKVLNNVNAFLGDIQLDLAGVPGSIPDISSLIGGISGSITSALSFENIKLNVFPTDLLPSCPASDYFTLSGGGGAAEEPQQPRPAEVDKAASNPTQATPTPEVPYASPSGSTPDVDFGTRAEAIEAINSGAVVIA